MKEINTEILIDYIEKIKSSLNNTLVINKEGFNEKKLDELKKILSNY